MSSICRCIFTIQYVLYRIQRHRRLHEPEVIGGSSSEEEEEKEAQKRDDAEQSSEEEEELDEEVRNLHKICLYYNMLCY